MNAYLVLELSSFCVASFRSTPNISDRNPVASKPQTGIYSESFRDATPDLRDAVIWSSQMPISRDMKLAFMNRSPDDVAYGRKPAGPE